MPRTVVRTRVPSVLRATAAAILMASVIAACGSSASTPAAGQPTTAPAVSAAASVPAAQTPAASVAAPSAAAARTADPVLANALAQLNALTSYQFKFTLKGGSYAASVGTAGVVGTVVNSPSFAVQFKYVDIEIIEIQGKNWTKNGRAWDLSPYPDRPTTYDSYGPAILLSHYFPASVAAYYTAAGDETVNGVLTTRYTAAPQILTSMFNYWGVIRAVLAGGRHLDRQERRLPGSLEGHGDRRHRRPGIRRLVRLRVPCRHHQGQRSGQRHQGAGFLVAPSSEPSKPRLRAGASRFAAPRPSVAGALVAAQADAGRATPP